MYISTQKKHLTYSGDPLCKFFFIARGVQLENGVDPRDHCTSQKEVGYVIFSNVSSNLLMTFDAEELHHPYAIEFSRL